jgi:hypothetical protein
MSDLIEECLQAIDQHSNDGALLDPADRAAVLSALIILDGLNGLRKAIAGRE